MEKNKHGWQMNQGQIIMKGHVLSNTEVVKPRLWFEPIKIQCVVLAIDAMYVGSHLHWPETAEDETHGFWLTPRQEEHIELELRICGLTVQDVHTGDEIGFAYNKSRIFSAKVTHIPKRDVTHLFINGSFYNPHESLVELTNFDFAKLSTRLFHFNDLKLVQ
jgi:hypothetical protein